MYLPPRMKDPTPSEVEAARAMSNAINSMSDDGYTVGKLIANDHRTLQQSFMKVVVGFIAEMADHKDTNFYDARNEGAVTAARQIVDMWDTVPTSAPVLPFI